MAEKIQHAVVIGAGTMGSGIAIVFAGAGWRVSVVDPSADARASLATRMRESMARLGTTLNTEMVHAYATLTEVEWPSANIVCESALENLPFKQKLFAELEALAPSSIPITSNSTGYPISEIAKGLKTQIRMLGMHFLMPAQFVPLVELIPSDKTDPGLVAELRDLMRKLGKRPVLVKKPLIGFIANRIQAALMREAVSLIDRGIASAEDVDTAVRFGFGFRYAAAGPIVQKEHGGWEISYGLYEKVFPDLCNDDKPSPILSNMISSGHYGMKTGQGFMKWDAASKAAEIRRYETALREALDILRKEDQPD